MDDGLVLRIGADVTPAVQGLQQVEQRMRSTVAAGQSFGKGIDKSVQSLSKLPGSSNQATQSLINLSRVAQDAPYGFIGIANNINPLLESFQRLKATTGTTGGALKSMGAALTGPAGIGLAVGVVSSLLVVFGDRLFGAGKAAKAAKEATEELAKSLSQDFVKLATLVGIAQNVNASTEDRKRAIKDLNEQYGKYLSLTDKDVINSSNLIQSYNSIVDALLRRAVIAGLQKEIEAEVESTAKEILKIERSRREEADRIAKTKEQNATKVQASEDRLFKAVQRSNRNVSDGYLQQIDLQSELIKGKAAFEKVDAIDKLKAKLFESLKPLMSIINSYKDIASSFKDVLDLKSDKKDVPIKVKPVIDLPGLRNARLELPAGTAVLRAQQMLIGKPETLTFTDAFQKQLTEKIEKLIVAPNIKVAENKELKKQAEDRVAMHKQEAAVITSVLTPAFDSMFNALAQGGNAFKAFGQAAVQALTQLIGKLVTTAAIAAILGPILGIGTTALGSASNSFKDVFGSLFGSLFGGFRASGGPVEAGRAYITGEAGRELFVPSVSGSIVPNHQLGSFSTGRSSSSGTMRAVVRGQNILLSVARTTRSNNRLGLNGI